MNQDRAAQVWKGPWKCEKCGKSGSDYWRQIVNEHGYHVLNENENCTGRIVPYDRRNLEDWKAEREKLIGALEDNEHFKNAVEKFCEEKQGQQNMTDKLEGFSTGWLAARAALAEVTGEKKELPKFKDIIGLFVDKPEQEKK